MTKSMEIENQSLHGELRTAFYNPHEVKRRRRTSKSQFKILEKAFIENPKPDASTRRHLAQRLSMSPRGIQVWFQNRRAKNKQANVIAGTITATIANSNTLKKKNGTEKGIILQNVSNAQDRSNSIQMDELPSPKSPLSSSNQAQETTEGSSTAIHRKDESFKNLDTPVSGHVRTSLSAVANPSLIFIQQSKELTLTRGSDQAGCSEDERLWTPLSTWKRVAQCDQVLGKKPPLPPVLEPQRETASVMQDSLPLHSRDDCRITPAAIHLKVEDSHDALSLNLVPHAPPTNQPFSSNSRRPPMSGLIRRMSMPASLKDNEASDLNEMSACCSIFPTQGPQLSRLDTSSQLHADPEMQCMSLHSISSEELTPNKGHKVSSPGEMLVERKQTQSCSYASARTYPLPRQISIHATNELHPNQSAERLEVMPSADIHSLPPHDVGLQGTTGAIRRRRRSSTGKAIISTTVAEASSKQTTTQFGLTRDITHTMAAPQIDYIPALSPNTRDSSMLPPKMETVPSSKQLIQPLRPESNANSVESCTNNSHMLQQSLQGEHQSNSRRALEVAAALASAGPSRSHPYLKRTGSTKQQEYDILGIGRGAASEPMNSASNPDEVVPPIDAKGRRRSSLKTAKGRSHPGARVQFDLEQSTSQTYSLSGNDDFQHQRGQQKERYINQMFNNAGRHSRHQWDSNLEFSLAEAKTMQAALFSNQGHGAAKTQDLHNIHAQSLPVSFDVPVSERPCTGNTGNYNDSSDMQMCLVQNHATSFSVGEEKANRVEDGQQSQSAARRNSCPPDFIECFSKDLQISTAHSSCVHNSSQTNVALMASEGQKLAQFQGQIYFQSQSPAFGRLQQPVLQAQGSMVASYQPHQFQEQHQLNQLHDSAHPLQQNQQMYTSLDADTRNPVQHVSPDLLIPGQSMPPDGLTAEMMSEIHHHQQILVTPSTIQGPSTSLELAFPDRYSLSLSRQDLHIYQSEMGAAAPREATGNRIDSSKADRGASSSLRSARSSEQMQQQQQPLHHHPLLSDSFPLPQIQTPRMLAQLQHQIEHAAWSRAIPGANAQRPGPRLSQPIFSHNVGLPPSY
ncbi:hypothetical protein BX616_002076 [Lobosporangium transversale]|nr:hypothetical protein BX616_002076 [Lobosporangium transversale]